MGEETARRQRLLEEQNGRLPEGWFWELGGNCARLYQPNAYGNSGPSHTAWAHSDGRAVGYPEGSPVYLGIGALGFDKGDFDSALVFLTDAALATIAARDTT